MAQTLIAVSPDELAELMRKAVADALEKSPPAPAKRYLDAAEIAKHFSVSRTLVNQWTKQDGCPHILKGKILRFELAAVETWFRGREAGLRRVK
jgi:hypothetical protein